VNRHRRIEMRTQTSISIVAGGLILAGVSCASVSPNVSISGSTKECFMGSMAVGGVNLAAFQVSAARPIAAQLDTMTKFTGFATTTYAAASQKYDSLYDQTDCPSFRIATAG
jgi:hypothetical protein